MTLDDVVASMRARFTPAQPGQVVKDARITAEEWNALAAVVYLRDAIENIAAAPPEVRDDLVRLAQAEVDKSRSPDPARVIL